MRRSPAAAAAIMGVWKLGATYAPLDRNAPWPFQRFVLEDSEARAVLVASGEIIGDLPAECRLFNMPTMTAIASRAPAAPDVPAPIDPDDAAWVLYTSGSTGRPKGVVGTHRGSLNRCRWLWRSHPFQPGEVAVQNTALTVVDSVWEIWAPLAQGVPVLMPEPNASLDPLALIGLLAKCEVTRICLVPTFLRILLDAKESLGEALPKMRAWICSGEPLDQALAARFRQAVPRGVLLNQYGLTETCADITSHVVSEPARELTDEGGITPVGRPIDNVKLRVADPEGQAKAQGEIGELWVAGEALARGYIGLPELTAHRFVLREEAGSPCRWLRTGDLARMDASGVVTVLGRADRQVKVRGLRVELEGVEAVLASHPGVQSCAVIQLANDGRLVGYATPRRGHEALDGPALHLFLRKRLPAHMVPARILVRPRFALTQSGKIDYAALPDIRAVDDRSASTPPRTPLERKIAGLWADLLKVPHIGVDDEFFALGGDSLLLIRILAELATRHGVHIAPSAFLKHPTVAGTAQLIDEYSARMEPLPPTSTTRPDALTQTQAMIWVQDRSADADGIYNIALVFELRGIVHQAALREAASAVIVAHDALRTHFRATPNGLSVTVGANPPNSFATQDMTGVDEDQVMAVAEAEAHRPFDLEHDSLLRLLLIAQGPDSSFLVVTAHHIACDGHSFGRVLTDLSRAYADRKAGRTATLPSSSVSQWSAFSARTALAALPPDIHFPPFSIAADRPRSRASGRGAVLEFALEQDRLSRVNSAARSLRISTFVFALAAFVRTAHAHSNDAIVTVRVPLADRFEGADDVIVGCLMRVVPLSFDLSGDPTFATLGQRVQEALWQAYEGKARHPPEPSSGLIFAFDDLHDTELDLDGLRVQQRSLPRRASIADVFLSVNRSDVGWRVQVEYATDLFDEPTIRAFLDHYTNILDAAAAQPEAHCSSLFAIGQTELGTLLEIGSGPERPDFPLDCTLDSLIGESIGRNPTSRAGFSGAVLTHRELLADADRLAVALQQRGIGANDVVGVHLDRSFDQLVVILAILRAGAAYLPLDPQQPIDRLRQFTEESGAALVVTRPEQLGLWSRTAVSIDTLRAQAPDNDARPIACSSPDSPAYVIFTSGSTGRPKGIAIPHRAIVNELTWMLETFPLGAEDCYLQKTSIGFDVSVWGLFLPLLSGAKVEIAAPGAHQSMEYLVRTVVEASVTVTDFVPSLLHLFVEHIFQHRLTCRIRKLFSIGEALPQALALRARALVTDELYNLYGPTEATVHATWEACGHLTETPTTPIGRPIANTQAYVLDTFGAPVPAGVPGELFLGGVQVALGYVAQAELTAERFRPDRFRGHGRLYRTGDIVKWRRDGRLEYLGRLDRQLKIAGTRLEPAEVEAVLRTHPDLLDAFVTPTRPAGEAKQLIAYIVPKAGRTLTATDLQAHARQQLPSIAVPASFITLPAFPRLPSGKIDVNALPDPVVPSADASANDRSADSGRSRAGILRTLARITGVPMSESKSFIQCGGDSFSAMRAVAELKRSHSLAVSPFSLLSAANLAEFLDLLDAGGDLSGPRFSISSAQASADLPTSLQQERWIALADFGVVDLYCEIDGPVALEKLEAATASVVGRHRVLRSLFRADEPTRQVAIDIAPPITCTDLSRHSDAAARDAIAMAMSRCRKPFDIACEPPIALEALKLDEKRTLLLGRLHHIVTDGWSNSLLLEELEAAYEEIDRNGSDNRSPPVQYAEFARAQRAFINSRQSDAVRSWWRDRLAGVTSPTRLPRRIQTTALGHPDRADFVVKTLAPTARRRLQEAARARNGTLFTALLGAFALLMRDATGEPDVLFGTSLSGRHQPGAERVLGVFVNPLPVRARLSSGSDLSAIFDSIREEFGDLLQHQDYALTPLMEEAPVFSGADLNGAFDAHIVFQNYPAPSCTGPRHYRVIDPQDGNISELWGCPLGESRIMRALDLVAFDRSDGSISLNFGYKANLLDPRAVQSWADDFARQLYLFAQ
jgi:amino acid adenylation domain-containing protein